MANPDKTPVYDLVNAIDIESMQSLIGANDKNITATCAVDLGSRDPTYGLEVALAERFECETDDDVPYMTFALGSVYKSLRVVYDRECGTSPDMLIARFVIQERRRATADIFCP